ncbi:shikimate dehydrogenase family protein [Sphingomonas sp. GCM10030256]|uniref:shikimate dehydrogenase family protein n=1 Tax=Sphingomonas sp. GCM10030256 TaxID=3273427 RepID=UPI0036239A55
MTSARFPSPPGELPYAEVIGDPIEHSKSPVIHGFWLGKLGLAGDYRRQRVSRSELPAYLAARRDDSRWRGCSVTMPLKLDALMAAERRSDGAIQAGACNLLIPHEGGLLAKNTDIGAVTTVIARLAANRTTGSITVLGSGGAARAVLVACKRMGMERIAIHARNAAEARSLELAFDLTLPAQAMEAEIATDGLINATPLGMARQPPLNVDLGAMPRNGWVFDLVSNPARTPLVQEAERRGLAASRGLSMLVEQASEAFTYLFGSEPPRDAESEAELMRRLVG